MNGLEVRLRMRRQALALDVCLSTPARGVTALFGASGSGKTTILRCIAGLARAEDGHVALDGECWQDEARGRFVPPHERSYGYVFQEASLFPHLTVRRNLEYARVRASRSTKPMAFDLTVEMLGLGPLLDRGTEKLSGGERQRVAMARALLTNPRLLLMDEPLASLDASRKGEILHYIERLRDDLGIPIVYVSHAIEEVVRLADRLVVISEGRTLAAGPVAELSSRLDLRPHLGRFEAGAVIEAVVADHDLAYGLTRLTFDAGEIFAPDVQALRGERLRIRIRARDVAIALSRPRDASFLNVIEGVIAEVGRTQGSGVDIVVALGASRLVARVTRKSAETLQLVPGKRVYALIKSVAVDRHSMGYA